VKAYEVSFTSQNRAYAYEVSFASQNFLGGQQLCPLAKRKKQDKSWRSKGA
jgi:hypothetical protein